MQFVQGSPFLIDISLIRFLMAKLHPLSLGMGYPFVLIQFSIKNYRSIKDRAMIRFAASKDKSLESYRLNPDEKRALYRFLPIYGANAAGKRNVLHTLMTMMDMVVGESSTRRERSFCL